jgi:hypothetical protein
MATAPLARDQAGIHFDLPETAAFWRVRKQTGGRPSTVLGPDGEPLFMPVDAAESDLYANGCTSGSYRLEAVDAQRRSVGAMAAFVDLGTDERTALAANGNNDLVRTSFEAMTRTMEAMQRAQVERERALAQKERAFTDAQVAAQRMHMELMVALMQRFTPGAPQDAMTIMKQQFQLQRILDQNARRNAALPAAATSSSDPEDEAEQEETSPGLQWLKALSPIIPTAASTLQEVVVDAFAKGDPDKAQRMHRNASQFAKVVGSISKNFSESVKSGNLDVASILTPKAEDLKDDNVVEDSAEEQLPRPRSIRELLARLDDDEAEAFDEYLDTLDAVKFNERVRESEAIANPDERTAWARRLLETEQEESDASTDAVGVSQIPPALIPVAMQLSEEERQACMQLLTLLDRKTIDDLVKQLSSLPTDRAVGVVRRALAEAQRRGPSIAQRAVFAALRSEEGKDADPNGGAS